MLVYTGVRYTIINEDNQTYLNNFKPLKLIFIVSTVLTITLLIKLQAYYRFSNLCDKNQNFFKLNFEK